MKKILSYALSISLIAGVFGTFNVAYAEDTAGYEEIYVLDFDALDTTDALSNDQTAFQAEYANTKLVSNTSGWGFKVVERDSDDNCIYLSQSTSSTSGNGGDTGIFITVPDGGLKDTEKYRISYDVKWDTIRSNGPYIRTKTLHYTTSGYDNFGPVLNAMRPQDVDGTLKMMGSHSTSNYASQGYDNSWFSNSINSEDAVFLDTAKWHTVEIIMDCLDASDKKIEYYYDGEYAGEQSGSTFPNWAVMPGRILEIFAFQGYQAWDGVYFDNVKIEKAVPAVVDISFVDASGEKIEFSQEIETVSKRIEVEAINIKNETEFINGINLSDTDIDVYYDSESDVYVIETEDYLAAGDYTLTILGETYEFEIAGTYSISDVFLKKGNDIVDDLADVSSGDELSVNVEVVATSAEEKDFIFAVACYDGNHMKSLRFKSFTDEENEVLKSDSFEFVVPECDNPMIKLFVIDDFENNNLLRECIVFGENTDTAKFMTVGEEDINLANEEVAIAVFAPDKTIDNLAELAEMKDVLAYYDHINADADGRYSVDINLDDNNDSGIYKAYATRKGKTVFVGEKRFVSATDNKTSVEELLLVLEENLPTADIKANFIEKAKEDRINLGFGEFTEEVPQEAYEILYIYYKKNTIDSGNLQANIKIARQCERLAIFNADDEEDNIFSDDNDFAEIFPGVFDDIEEFFDKNYFTNTFMKRVTSDVKGTDSIADIKDVVNEQFVLNLVKNSNGYENLTPVLKKFYQELGFTGSGKITDAISRKINGDTYDDFESLGSAIKKLISTPQGTQGGGSSSSSSQASSSGGGFVAVKPSTNSQTENNKPAQIPQNMYTDIDDEYWARDAIVDLTVKGIMNGTGDGTFKPQETVTREQFTKMVVVAFCEEELNGEINFVDVSNDAWYYEYISLAHQVGLINGVSDTAFGVGENITRQDMAVILNRAAAKYNYNFKMPDVAQKFDDDTAIADYAKEAVYTLKNAGVLKGKGDGFEPESYATRAEAATLIYNMISM